MAIGNRQDTDETADDYLIGNVRGRGTGSRKRRLRRAEMPVQSWWPYLRTVSRDEVETEVQSRLEDDLTKLIKQYQAILEGYCSLCLFLPDDSISAFEADKIYQALARSNPNRENDILLMIVSTGGEIEPAYQISKLCRAFAKERFVVVVPREAKSAATLIALGADEIHLGPLGQLGPIDPQIGGLPAIGVAEALKFMAQLASDFPRSADMFARYLQRALTVEQIGYCQRIGESAAQYAERLLATKTNLPHPVQYIARQLVYEYKDHSFVIDREEAEKLLGSSLVVGESDMLKFADDVYELLSVVDLGLGSFHNKRLLKAGQLASDALITNIGPA